MPSIQVTGQLVDPTTGVEGSADIRIASVINYSQTTKKSISHKSTDTSGNYDFQLVYGKHLIFVKYEDERIYIPIGYAVVGDSTPDPIDLIQLINLSDENPPSELVTELQQLREDTLNDIVGTSAQVLENAGYQGEWVSGTSTALKGETWQVSGRYYVALKNTSVDPINDDDNWREVVNTKFVTTAQNDIVGGSIFKGSNGETVEDGDVVEPGTTHLRVLVGGKPVIVAINPIASGLVSSLTDSTAIIGGVNVNFQPAAERVLSDIEARGSLAGKVVEGQRISWLGYYQRSDGGSNWGVVRVGPHIEDGGSIFSVDANTYIEANITRNMDVRKFGVISDGTNQSEKIEKALAVTGISITSILVRAENVNVPSDSSITSKKGGELYSETPDANCLILNGVSNCEIKKTKISVSNVKQTTASAGNCVYITGCTDIEVTRNKLLHNGGSGVVVNNTTSFDVYKNKLTQNAYSVSSPSVEFENGQAPAIQVNDGCSQFTVCKNRITNSSTGINVQTFAAGNQLIDLGTVSGNIINSCSTYGVVVYAQQPGNHRIRRINVINNIINNIHGSTKNILANGDKTFGSGIYSLNCESLNINGNNVTKTNIQTDGELLTPAAIAVAESRGAVNIVGNIVEEAYWFGIAAFTCNYGGEVSITSNQVRSVKNGIYSKNSSDVSAVGNTVNSPGARGIFFFGQTSRQFRCFAKGNTIGKGSTIGIGYYNIENFSSNTNTILEASIRGIDYEECNRGGITGNTIIGDTEALRCEASQNTLATGNTIDVNGEFVFSARQSSSENNAFRGNHIVGAAKTQNLGGAVVEVHASSPVSGSTYQVGDRLIRDFVVAGGFSAQVCVTAGSDSTAVFKNYGLISS